MSFIAGFKKGFKDLGNIFTNIVNFILLLFVYYIGVGISAIAAKIAGKHFLSIKKERKKTYWQKYTLKKEPIENYYRQF